MDETSGQFYAVNGNSYQRMSTKLMLKQTWATGELIDQLAVTRQAFGYAGLAGSTPASTSHQPNDLLPKQPAPKTVQYQPPSFKLTRPTAQVQVQVHHNYISAVSSLEHKKDLINRLKQSDTHNISAYEAEMSRHMTLHEDVLERIPPTYKFFTLHIYFHTQTHLHIRTYFTTTSNNTKYKKSKYRIFTPKFTTLWTTGTYKLNQHFRHTISRYTPTAICIFTTTTIYSHTNTSHITKTP